MISIPSISDSDIFEVAERFLSQYHPVGTPPIPIESIVEYGMGIAPVAIDGLRREFGPDGFISQDLQHIVVDAELMKFPFNLNRLRFTMAEEASHYLLHAPWIQKQRASTLEEWKEYVRWLCKHDGPLERQARRCAAAILVPRRHSERQYPDGVPCDPVCE